MGSGLRDSERVGCAGKCETSWCGYTHASQSSLQRTWEATLSADPASHKHPARCGGADGAGGGWTTACDTLLAHIFKCSPAVRSILLLRSGAGGAGAAEQRHAAHGAGCDAGPRCKTPRVGCDRWSVVLRSCPCSLVELGSSCAAPGCLSMRTQRRLRGSWSVCCRARVVVLVCCCARVMQAQDQKLRRLLNYAVGLEKEVGAWACCACCCMWRQFERVLLPCVLRALTKAVGLEKEAGAWAYRACCTHLAWQGAVHWACGA